MTDAHLYAKAIELSSRNEITDPYDARSEFHVVEKSIVITLKRVAGEWVQFIEEAST